MDKTESEDELIKRYVKTLQEKIREVEAQGYERSQLILELAKARVAHENDRQFIEWVLNDTTLSDVSATLATSQKEHMDSHSQWLDIADGQFSVINSLKGKPKAISKKGGDATAAKITPLIEKTEQLYEIGLKEGRWKSAPHAAREITPKIVAFSRIGTALHAPVNLLDTTTKPLDWIREYIRKSKQG